MYTKISYDWIEWIHVLILKVFELNEKKGEVDLQSKKIFLTLADNKTAVCFNLHSINNIIV